MARSSGRTIGHFLVLPRDHVADFTTDPVVSATVQMRAAELAQKLCGRWNYPTSCGEAATQTVFHLHGLLVARTAGDGLALPWNHPTSNRLTEPEDEIADLATAYAYGYGYVGILTGVNWVVITEGVRHGLQGKVHKDMEDRLRGARGQSSWRQCEPT
ncbi:HIT family protein [Streptomyces sp. NPDC056672]|uniref:HIT family protein n=1 Tax=Streptomyces sp. NPDC056672 TaxID=3345906 RepID=UPI003695D562